MEKKYGSLHGSDEENFSSAPVLVTPFVSAVTDLKLKLNKTEQDLVDLQKSSDKA